MPVLTIVKVVGSTDRSSSGADHLLQELIRDKQL